jgi:proteasome assembly chaperone (PAC2) family protein
MESENLIWHEKPVPSKPFLILALSGWGNAGEVPSSVLWYLLSRFESVLFAEIKPDKFYIYQSAGSENKRSVVNIENGLIQSYSMVTTNFWYHKAEPGEHDIIFVQGPEPEQGWSEYTEIILNLIQEYQVEKIVTLGGAFDAIPHTVSTRITGVVSHSDLKAEVEEQGIELVSYKGPTSINTFLMVEAAKKDIPVISLWAHTPHYIQVTNFIACYDIMLKLSGLLGLKIDLEIAKKDSEYLANQIDQAVEKKPELQEYLKTLESEYHKGNPDNQRSINKNIVKEIEDLFRDSQT